jgi:DNA repair exonuclease SbcCD nuclease subunit
MDRFAPHNEIIKQTVKKLRIMFRFIHAADVHLDSPLHKLGTYEGIPIDQFRQATRRAFENLVQLAISKKVSFILIAGDLYDGNWKDYNTGLYLTAQMKRLHDADIQVFIVGGNHDAASRITRVLRFPKNVTLFSASKPETFCLDDFNVAVHGQGFATLAVKKDLSKNYPQAVAGYYNIGLLHTCATGREGHENYAPCSVEGLQSMGYDYWALGHVHTYEVLSENPPIIFSGNIQGRHVKETGPKGCVLVTVDDDGRTDKEFVPLDVVRWEVLHLDATLSASGYEIIDRLSSQIEGLIEANSGMPMALRVLLKGETIATNEILSDTERWINEIRSCAIDAGEGQVWVEKVKFDLRLPVSDKPPEEPEGAIGELLLVFEELRSDKKAQLRLFEELSDLQRKLPRELQMNPEGAEPGDQGLIDLLDHAQQSLMKRLLKRGLGDADR